LSDRPLYLQGVQVALIQVPYAIGDDRHGASNGAARLVEAGAAGDRGGFVESVVRPGPFGDSVSASTSVNKEVAAVVARAIEADLLPIILAGSCDVCIGVLAGFAHSRCGVVWIDAHADFNTPESTVSGFFPGMSAAVITGHCYRKLWAEIGDSTPVREEAVVMLGVRDLAPEEERERLERSAIRVVAWEAGRRKADVVTTLNELAGRVDEVYLHVDLDAFDPEVAPAVFDAPVPGGLSLADARELIGAVHDRFRIKAAAVTTYNPDLDEDARTLELALDVIELISGRAADPRGGGAG
jgi:arginase